MKPVFTSKSFLKTLFILLGIIGLPFAGHVQNFPPIPFVISDSTAVQGFYFMSPYTNSPVLSYDRPHLILDKYGRIIYYRIFQDGQNLNPTIDFKLQPDGRMSYFNTNTVKFYLMDSTFAVVDSIACTHGFETDQHDLQVLPGNHLLLIGKETRIMNLSSYHWFGINHNLPGGVNAQVTGVVIQEFDEDKALVWEWKGHDHYQFSDVDPEWLFIPNKVDWTHANAVELDNDGNILLSLRHFNEITKIDHESGNILWRMGGKQNQFSFPNDPIRFTGQHDIRRVSDTSVSLYDNGQYSSPPMSRALEYALDESSKIARLVWEYIYDSAMYSIACGNHQYVNNGNHLVDFGFVNSAFPWMVVVRPDKSKVLEISMPEGYISYRAFNYLTLPFVLHQPEVYCRKIGESYFLVAEAGHPEYKWSTGDSSGSIQITQTGEYWVFVPYGAGYISSEHINIKDIANPCLATVLSPSEVPPGMDLRCIPNPAAGHTQIIFDLASAGKVTLSLNNLLGKEIMKPVNGYYKPGIHSITCDISALGPGIYLLLLTSEKTRLARRLIIR